MSLVKLIKIYLWKPKLPNVGHISMELTDGTYISFWPLEHSLWKKSSQGKTYQQDETEEGREADETLSLPSGMVDQARIKRWWKFVSCIDYHLLKLNCATMIKRALRIGGILKDIKTPVEELRLSRKVKEFDIPKIEMVDTPVGVFSWALACKEVWFCRKCPPNNPLFTSKDAVKFDFSKFTDAVMMDLMNIFDPTTWNVKKLKILDE